MILNILLIYLLIGIGLMYYGRTVNPPANEIWYFILISYLMGAIFWPMVFIKPHGASIKRDGVLIAIGLWLIILFLIFKIK